MTVPRKILTAGYGSGWTIETMHAALAEHDAALIDIRYVPWSNFQPWRKDALSEAIGDRYIYLRAFGNVNYKGGPIRIASPAQGLTIMDEIWARYLAVILLCGCRDHHQCHRQTVAALIERDLTDQGIDCTIEHLYPSPKHQQHLEL